MQASHRVVFYSNKHPLDSKTAKTWYKNATGDFGGKTYAGLIGGKLIEYRWEGNVLYQRVGLQRSDDTKEEQKFTLKSILEMLADPDDDGNYPIPSENNALARGKRVGKIIYYSDKPKKGRSRSRSRSRQGVRSRSRSRSR